MNYIYMYMSWDGDVNGGINSCHLLRRGELKADNYSYSSIFFSPSGKATFIFQARLGGSGSWQYVYLSRYTSAALHCACILPQGRAYIGRHADDPAARRCWCFRRVHVGIRIRIKCLSFVGWRSQELLSSEVT